MVRGVSSWEPTEKQGLFLECPADEVLFGGSAGPGKSEAMLVAALGTAGCGFFNNGNWRALILRRTYPELEKSIIQRSLQLLHGKAKYDAVKKRWVSGCGGVLQFGVVENENDVVKHQGAEYNFIGFDELTHFSERMYMFLKSRLRTTDPTIQCVMRATSNPGGIGHGWVKKRFIDGCRPYEIRTEVTELPGGGFMEESRCFIPARVYDNPHLVENDPQYVMRLMSLPDVERRAFLEGDWNIFSGQFFTEFSEDHVIEPFDFPLGWPVWVSMDYGFATKCAIGFYVQDPVTGVYYMFDELYVSKMHPDEISSLIKSKLGNRFRDVVARYSDKRILVKDEETQISTQEKFAFNGIYFQIATLDRIEGWMRCRELLMRDADEELRFKVFSTCKEFIRTIPEQVHDIKNPEDLDKRGGEDHFADQFRYFAIMRKVHGIERRDVVEPVQFSGVTGYPGLVGDEELLRNRIPRLTSLVKGKNYFYDKVEVA